MEGRRLATCMEGGTDGGRVVAFKEGGRKGGIVVGREGRRPQPVSRREWG